jgi:hypothetical protein
MGRFGGWSGNLMGETGKFGMKAIWDGGAFVSKPVGKSALGGGVVFELGGTCDGISTPFPGIGEKPPDIKPGVLPGIPDGVLAVEGAG